MNEIGLTDEKKKSGSQASIKRDDGDKGATLKHRAGIGECVSISCVFHCIGARPTAMNDILIAEVLPEKPLPPTFLGAVGEQARGTVFTSCREGSSSCSKCFATDRFVRSKRR